MLYYYQMAFVLSKSKSMEYKIVLVESEEGWAVSCPALRGCHSQGTSREEAIDNIRIAICEWLDAGEKENTA